MKIVLTYPTETGLQEIPLESATLSFGRGSEADHRFADDGLSRLHSTIYREGDQIWIVDENSTNGTFVNGQPVGASGTALENGDTIRIGNYTSLKVKFAEETAPVSTAGNQTKSAGASSSTQSSGGLVKLIPIVAIVIAFFVISISAVVIGIKIFVKEPPPIVERDPDNDPTPDKEPTKETATPKPKTSVTPIGSTVGNENINSGDPLPTPDKIPDVTPAIGKKYSEMSEAERRAYVETKVQKVAAMIGNRSGGEIPPLAVDSIKQKLDGYFKRIRASRVDDCNQGSWVRSDMISVLERARKNAPFIIHSFNQEGVDPQVGLYLAMIESEHCVCLQSPTGPLGMFQFTKATGEAYGLQTIKGANPNNPDERCKPEPSARAAAKYMKFLTGRYGTGPASFPLAIASYNSGEGGLSKNLQTALNADSSLSRDFWSLIANSQKLSKQFQDENFKYPPKFFAAAIIGENPQDFGVNLQPLSTYTK